MLMFLTSLVLGLVKLIRTIILAVLFFYLIFVVGWLVLCGFILQNTNTH